MDLPDLPPVLPNAEKQLKDFIVCLDKLPMHKSNAQFHWPHTSHGTLFGAEYSGATTSIKVVSPLQRKMFPNSPEVMEVPVDVDSGSVKMSSLLEPTWAGQYNDPTELYKNGFEIDLDVEKDLDTVPPGFSHGIDFTSNGAASVVNTVSNGLSLNSDKNQLEELEQPLEIVNVLDLVEREKHFMEKWNNDFEDAKEKEDEIIIGGTPSEQKTLDDSDVIPKAIDLPVLKIKDTVPLNPHANLEWAELLDISKPVPDFEQKIPVMAHKYDFELDVFQKLAVIKLEEHCDVFVAAHTSAGKTVVAEYAIALSMKHMTKAIYTSPVKALSHQKYRDLKQIFGDVGLITGDFKINETASCLIMTTEILRSMLYNRSDVVPDLEYVIFDEVHYINDSGRGHVWEEVFIMLPKNVSLVMLSATVPNVMAFAQWVGSTRKKKVHVLTTHTRPVPLDYYLYTGTGGVTKDDRFLIMDGKGTFYREGFIQAELSRQKKTEKPNNKSAPTAKSVKPNLWKGKQEKSMWVSLIGHLREREELPVIAFTLSRNRCDHTAEEMAGLDLTTATEKNTIEGFFHKCIQQLQDADKNLPQVLRMKQHLRSGIGVHHSGILPLLKEIVEMLFQDGLVKLLFATETLAMGVNMPTRTVVFESTRKFDGTEWRTLLPGEFIQMAGRAGRRGKDRVGNVIILCRQDIPKEVDIKNMMLGKPTYLESKFRLTYKMILNLLLRENLKVEEMMSRSFKECSTQYQKEKCNKELEEIEKQIERTSLLNEGSNDCDMLREFVREAIDFVTEWDRSWGRIVEAVGKFMVSGRVVLVSHKEHRNSLGVFLQTEVVKQEKFYRVLVLCNAASDTVPDPDSFEINKILSFALPRKIFEPDVPGEHTIILVPGKDILKISNVELSVKDPRLVREDWEKRQMARFRDAPVGQTCAAVVLDLGQTLHRFLTGDGNVKWLHPVRDMKINNINLSDIIHDLFDHQEYLEQSLCIEFGNFEEQVREIYSFVKLEKRKAELKYKLSYESLSLYPDYQNRLKVLKELRYIKDDLTVEMKGKVACEMGSNELMITELVMENILSDLPSAEIAALLSCLVSQRASEEEQTFTKELEKGISEIIRVHEKILYVENKCDVGKQDPSCEDENKLSFNLVQVVYEWANAKPFSEIMRLTEIQEGIIVRCIQQLHETLQEVKRAARIYGDSKLSNKMDEASNAIKRDIVFSPSLYTKQDSSNKK